MKTAVITCRTVEDELRAAMRRAGTEYPVFWLESGLHNTPKKLTNRLNELIPETGAERVLLAMGFCGNAMAGVRAEGCELILPRADDCISLLLGSDERRLRISSALSAYYLTDGWMRSERNIWTEYLRSVQRYGEETANEIAEMMYGHYRTLALVDCGLGGLERLLERTEPAARTLRLTQRTVCGTLSYLEALLTGPWDEQRFLRVPKGCEIALSDLWVKRERTGFEPDEL